MKYYNTDIVQLLPDNIPVNTDNHVEYTGFINDFFLRGFYNYYSQLFKTHNNALTQDFAKSCMSLYSRYAALLSSDNQLQDRITNEGLNYYSLNSHETDAYFLYELNTTPINSESGLASFIHYVANSYALNVEIDYEGFDPYIYGLNLSGDITATSNIEATLNRLKQLLLAFTPIHTKLYSVSFEDTANNINTYAAMYGDDLSYSYDVKIPIPFREPITIGSTITVPVGTTKLVSKYWWVDNFGYASGMANLWTPVEFAGSVNDMATNAAIDDTEFSEARFVDTGSADTPIKNLRDLGIRLQIKMYSGKPEMYTTSNDAVSGPSNCGLVVVPGSSPTWTNETEWGLPSSLYTISGTTLTWNNSHILMHALDGFEAYAVGD